MDAFDETWSLLLLKHSITKGSHKTMLIIAEDNPDDEEALAEMKRSFPHMSDEQAMSSLKEARDYNEHHMSGTTAYAQPEPKISNIMDDENSIRENNPNAKNLVGGDQTPQPQQDPNPLDLSMDKLKELDGGQ